MAAVPPAAGQGCNGPAVQPPAVPVAGDTSSAVPTVKLPAAGDASLAALAVKPPAVPVAGDASSAAPAVPAGGDNSSAAPAVKPPSDVPGSDNPAVPVPSDGPTHNFRPGGNINPGPAPPGPPGIPPGEQFHRIPDGPVYAN